MQEFCRKTGLRWKVKNYKNFHSALFLGKKNDKIFKKCKISYFWALFVQMWAKINFPQKLGTVTF